MSPCVSCLTLLLDDSMFLELMGSFIAGGVFAYFLIRFIDNKIGL
jgi:hypothetical protein